MGGCPRTGVDYTHYAETLGESSAPRSSAAPLLLPVAAVRLRWLGLVRPPSASTSPLACSVSTVEPASEPPVNKMEQKTLTHPQQKVQVNKAETKNLA